MLQTVIGASFGGPPGKLGAGGTMNRMTNLLGEPQPTFLTADSAAADLAAGTSAAVAAESHPDSVLAWSMLAEKALADGDNLNGYAFARTGYHRSLDMLRGSGWKGHGPVPWTHEPNKGFLRSLAMLAEASERLGDIEETHRCREFLHESSPEAYAVLIG